MIKTLRKKRIVVTALAVIGIVGLLSTAVYAAVNVYSASEAESGTRTGNVTTEADATASSGTAVKFGASGGVCETTGPGGYALPNLVGYANSCNTGPRYACTSTYTGNFTTTTNGQLIEGICINGSLRIDHDNVIVRDVRIAPTSSALYLLDIGRYHQTSGGACPSNLLVEYTEMDNSALGNLDWGIYQRCASPSGNHTFDHVKVQNIGRGINLGRDGDPGGNVVLTNSYVYAQYTQPLAHRTAVSTHGGSGYNVANNTLICAGQDCSSVLNMYSDYGPVTNYTMEGNVVAGGSICVRAADNDDFGYLSHDIKIRNNRFSTVYALYCGDLQALTWYNPAHTGNELTGNVWHETGLPMIDGQDQP